MFQFKCLTFESSLVTLNIFFGRESRHGFFSLVGGKKKKKLGLLQQSWTKKHIECQFFFSLSIISAHWRNHGPKNIESMALLYYDTETVSTQGLKSIRYNGIPLEIQMLESCVLMEATLLLQSSCNQCCLKILYLAPDPTITHKYMYCTFQLNPSLTFGTWF